MKTLAALAFAFVLMAVAGGLPDKFPLPTYDQSGVSNVQSHTDAYGAQSLQYDVSDDMKAVVDWYRDRLQAQGFKIMLDQEMKDSYGNTRGMVQWSRCEGHRYASVGVGALAGGESSKPGAEITLEVNPTGC